MKKILVSGMILGATTLAFASGTFNVVNKTTNDLSVSVSVDASYGYGQADSQEVTYAINPTWTPENSSFTAFTVEGWYNGHSSIGYHHADAIKIHITDGGGTPFQFDIVGRGWDNLPTTPKLGLNNTNLTITSSNGNLGEYTISMGGTVLAKTHIGQTDYKF